LAQRAIEAAGIITVSLTQMPFISEKIGLPRALAIEFPFGMIFGRPGDRAMQLNILRRMLDAVDEIQTPGEIIELPYTWPEEERQKKDWFPKEPTPWMRDKDSIQEMLDFIQHGDPLQ
jgi:glycine reductase complex component B subunit gamma